MLTKFLKEKEDYFYAIFRILVGLLFMQHGLQKLFGSFGGVAGDWQPVALLSQFGLAGLIELLGGLAITLGLFTRLAALISGIEMLVAYFMAHVPNGFFPIVNKGELALLYFACLLVIFAFGARKLSLERLVLKKEFF